MTDLDLGIVAIREGNKSQGCKFLARWLKLHPEHAEAYDLLGRTLASLGGTSEAVTALKASVAENSSIASLRYNLGTLLLSTGQFDEAISELQAAVELEPRSAVAWSNLCAAARALGQLSNAELAGRQATRIDPDLAEGWINLGNTLKDRAQLDRALAAYERAATINSQAASALSNRLLARCYLETQPAALAAAHREFGQRLESHFPERPITARAKNDRMRIGYVSADFKLHSVAYFFGSLLNCHDRARFDLYLYSDVERPDAVTARMEKSATQWTNVRSLSDEELWAKIRSDNIDLLVDLSGHTGRRLSVFARRAAPIQVTWLGYPFSTGLTAFDYRITDAIADPPDSDQWYTERLLRLPGPFICYQPPASSPDTSPAPVLRNGYVTFGSFNHLAKLSEDTVVLFSAILQACPNSKLLLKCKSLSDAATAKATVDRFIRYGISPQALILRGHTPGAVAHLAAYADVDIALDPIPYNGTTTSLEALWMGVPVLTLRGHWHASRVGASVMSHLGLNSLVASTPEALLTLACELSSQSEVLAELRQVLRQLLLKSPLCDQRRFARDFEAALMSVATERNSLTRAAVP